MTQYNQTVLQVKTVSENYLLSNKVVTYTIIRRM